MDYQSVTVTMPEVMKQLTPQTQVRILINEMCGWRFKRKGKKTIQWTPPIPGQHTLWRNSRIDTIRYNLMTGLEAMEAMMMYMMNDGKTVTLYKSIPNADNPFVWSAGQYGTGESLADAVRELFIKVYHLEDKVLGVHKEPGQD